MLHLASACLAGTSLALALRIHDVQGARHLSPLEGESVTAVEGIVTAVGAASFYMQDDETDADETTSEGIRVHGRFGLKPGDRVAVDGEVRETRFGCTRCTPSDAAYDNLTTTEIVASAVRVIAEGHALPRAEPWFALGGAPLPPDPDSPALVQDVELEARLQPRAARIDRLESLEGMRIALDSEVVAGAAIDVDGVREMALRGVDAEPVMVSAVLGRSPPTASRGDLLSGRVEGVLDYRAGRFVLAIDSPWPSVREQLRPVSSLPFGSRDELSVAAFNLQNLAPSSPANKLDNLAGAIVSALAAPDVVIVEEVQDESGPRDDGVTSAAGTYRALTSAIQRLGGPPYAGFDLPPEDAMDGGEPGANIRVGLLVRSDRPLRVVERSLARADSAGGQAVRSRPAKLTSSRPVGLLESPARLSPDAPAFVGSRKPLVVQLAVGEGRGEQTWFVVGCHFVSQLGDAPRYGRFQPPERRSRAGRLAQAEEVARFVSTLLGADPNARVAVLGDFNDGSTSPVLARLRASGLQDVLASVVSGERYTHIFDGEGEDIDQLLVSPSLAEQLVAATVTHGNAGVYGAASDHDAVFARFRVDGLVSDGAGPARASRGCQLSNGTVPAFAQLLLLLSASGAYCGRRRSRR